MTSLCDGKVQMTKAEIISTLNRSSLPTIIIEGKDDLIVFRKLEEKFESIGLSVFPVGGRKMILELFDKSAELSAKDKVMFFADQDTWIYTGIPKEYQSEKLIFTTGYSIENDIISDGGLENLMSASEKAKFQNELKLFTCWYADAISKHLKDQSLPFESHPNHILDNSSIKNATSAEGVNNFV